jgi:tetratricopeptide (TPR) repeat protein
VRVHPFICIVAISLSLAVFYYLTFRNEINDEFQLVTKIVEKKIPTEDEGLTYREKTQNNIWETEKIKINYGKNLGLLQTLNDKIINSKKFTFFLNEFLNRSIQAKNEILSQNDFASKEFNSTNFLSTLFYTKYESENNNTHFVITKGKTKRTAKILQIAILKAITSFYENAESSILSIPEIKSQKQKIILLENKSNELVSRINKLKENNNDNLSSISMSSEIKILEQELEDLQKVYEEINSSNYLKHQEGFLDNDFLKSYGKIEEYVSLIQQLTRILKNNPQSSSAEQMRSNKSKLSSLLVSEYEKAINELAQDIEIKKNQLEDLKLKNIEDSSLSSTKNLKIPEVSLFKKVSNSLEKMKVEYYEKLKFWNESKGLITFLIE